MCVLYSIETQAKYVISAKWLIICFILSRCAEARML